jgi:hypothetical protein
MGLAPGHGPYHRPVFHHQQFRTVQFLLLGAISPAATIFSNAFRLTGSSVYCRTLRRAASNSKSSIPIPPYSFLYYPLLQQKEQGDVPVKFFPFFSWFYVTINEPLD